MSFLQTKRVIKMPNRARFRKCATCNEPKTAREFRTSNQNAKTMPVCWQCRHDDRRAEARFYGAKTRRLDSVFRQRFWAVKRLLDYKFSKMEVRRKRMRKEIMQQSAAYLKFPERVAAVVGKTYAVMGDDFKLADDEALTRIRDLLDELDATLIERNKKKRLSR